MAEQPTNEQIEQSRLNMLQSRGDAALEKAAKDRTDDDWADLAAHRAEFGEARDGKDKAWKKVHEEMDRRAKKKSRRVLYDNPTSPKDED